MKILFIIIPALAIITACSRPESPPTTPVNPPIVDSNNSTNSSTSEKH